MLARPKRRRYVYIWFAAILVVAALALTPAVVKAVKSALTNACIGNLRQIDGAKEQFAREAKIAEGTILTKAQEEQVFAYIKGGRPECRAGGVYSLNAVGEAPTCTGRFGDSHGL